jgi:hypothetical protein
MQDMRKKLLISLAPVLAVVAFVTMPTAAQAQRYNVNKTAAGEAHVPVISWGSLKLTNSAGGTPVECENAVGGWVDNVANVGHGETNGWTAYNCKDSECEAAGGKIGVVFENENGPQSNPVKLTWPSVLEGKSPKIRTKSTNVKVYVHCQFVGEPSEEHAGTGPLEGLEVRVSVEANAPGSVSCEAGPTSKGTSTPLTVNAELPLPGKVTFSGGAGGELACNNGGKGVTTGSLKVIGFEAGEEISTVNSPSEPPVEKLPGGTAFNGNVYGTKVEKNKEVPTIFWKDPTPITTHACTGGTVTVAVTAENTETHVFESKEVTLTENPTGSGTFTGVIPEMHPLHGAATVTIKATKCPESAQDQTLEFPIWIDPSGRVVDGAHEDAPVEGATVTLLSSPTLTGTYTAVPNGSSVMSPTNRVNPDMSSEGGQYGWEVIEGFYKIQATKAGCGTATSGAFTIPPELKNLELVLHCES